MVRRRNRFNLKFLRKFIHRFSSVFFKGLPLGIASFLILFLFFGVRQMLHADPYFQIERITVFPSGILNQAELRFLEAKAKGKSLLGINLKELSHSLERNSKIERAEVVRVLPKQLNVYLIKRMPMLQVQFKRNGSFFLISSDQVVTAINNQSRPDLLILEDYQSSKKTYSVGMLYQNSNFELLRNIFMSIQNVPCLRNENLIKMTTNSTGNISLFLKDGLELKMGKELNLSEASQMVLGSLLKSRDRSEYLYLDLRYRDIILKKKTD